MTHEAVHADSEQVGEAAQLRAGGLGWTITGQSDGGEDDLWEVCRLYSTLNSYSPGNFSLLGIEDVEDMARVDWDWVSLDPN